ncbi:MAG: hypothetical protein WBX17_14325 [Microbacterium sp.]
MKTLENRAGAYLTGDEIADAVMEYSGALVQEQLTEVIEIPYLAKPGLIHRVQLLIGWRTDVNAVKDGMHETELEDAEFLHTLRHKTERLRAPSGDVPFTEADVNDFFPGSEY